MHVGETGAFSGRVNSDPQTRVADLEQQMTIVVPHVHANFSPLAGVLGRVLQRFQAAEVNSRFHLSRVPSDAFHVDGHGQRSTAAG